MESRQRKTKKQKVTEVAPRKPRRSVARKTPVVVQKPVEQPKGFFAAIKRLFGLGK